MSSICGTLRPDMKLSDGVWGWGRTTGGSWRKLCYCRNEKMYYLCGVIPQWGLIAVCGCGVIGSHVRLRIWCREAWGFESLQPHKTEEANLLQVGWSLLLLSVHTHQIEAEYSSIFFLPVTYPFLLLASFPYLSESICLFALCMLFANFVSRKN